ncbi:hypothetical protein MNO14_15390 [Luteimonas sp. S4-F44]|uniref:DUF6683 family protein n=1 Tax=Luteimonas sp. S4-F44 TaxID=2925842 RepID=UPI001F52B7B1|nr:DUF6683 family protein [Luteimonas sp. S4-F44]UNK42298.1 hypothetical protein MNO14_15390 [Luteimonas sp. S4-F44]
MFDRSKSRVRAVAGLLMCGAMLLAAATGQGADGDAAVQRALQQAVSRPAPAQVDAQAVQTLSFRRDRAISERVQQETIQAFGRDPQQVADLEKVIGSGELLRQFDGILRRYGYDPTNLGDVLAAHLLISWEVANDRDSARVPEGQRAVRRQLIGPLAAVPQIAGMSDAAKQAQAERTAYLTMVSALSYQTMKRQGNREALAALASAARKGLQGSGIDLQRIELTDDGLVAR